MDIVNRISANLSLEKVSERDDLLQHYRPTMNASYNLGFEVSKPLLSILLIKLLNSILRKCLVYWGRNLYIRS